MNNLFTLTLIMGLLGIPIFIALALINVFRKRPSKKRLKFAGISAIICIVSLVGFGLTMDDTTSDDTDSHVVSTSESQNKITPETTVAEAIPNTLESTNTPIPTEPPTTQPPEELTTQPTEEPTTQPTEEPTTQPTEEPTIQPTEEPPTQPTEESTAQPTEEPTTQPSTRPDAETSVPETSQNADSHSGGDNFNTYDNSEQQQTTDTYVLNTSSKKIHYPSCSSVSKIAEKNYATSSESLDTLKARGYTTCGNCFK